MTEPPHVDLPSASDDVEEGIEAREIPREAVFTDRLMPVEALLPARGEMYAQVTQLFEDRAEAGRRISERLRHYRGSSALVVALPRGGVVLGFEIATALGLALEVLVVRKIGHPANPELGVGALVEGGVPDWDRESLRALRISAADLKPQADLESQEVARRVQLYRGGRPLVNVKGRTVILVDDGIATGSTVRAAISALRFRGARRVVVATGVAPAGTAKELRRSVDEWVCLATPQGFFSVGQIYKHFDEVGDELVLDLLQRARDRETGMQRFGI